MTRILAVSPHLDSAVLSIGAYLAHATRAGATVTVYTVFAGTAPPPYSPAAERMHAVWGLSSNEDAPLHRRKEDIAALGHLGVGWLHGRFLDSIYRRLPDGQWLAGHVAGGQKLALNEDAPESDSDLVAEIQHDIESAIDECDPTLLFTCAAIGDHPDHVATRAAALFAAHERSVPIRLWEDLPYAALRADAVEPPPGFHLGPRDFTAVDTEAWTLKCQAVQRYRTQMLMLNGPGKDLFGLLTDYARKNSPDGGYGETTWKVWTDADHSRGRSAGLGR